MPDNLAQIGVKARHFLQRTTPSSPDRTRSPPSTHPLGPEPRRYGASSTSVSHIPVWSAPLTPGPWMVVPGWRVWSGRASDLGLSPHADGTTTPAETAAGRGRKRPKWSLFPPHGALLTVMWARPSCVDPPGMMVSDRLKRARILFCLRYARARTHTCCPERLRGGISLSLGWMKQVDRTGPDVGDLMEVRRVRAALLSPAASHSVGVGHPESVAPRGSTRMRTASVWVDHRSPMVYYKVFWGFYPHLLVETHSNLKMRLM